MYCTSTKFRSSLLNLVDLSRLSDCGLVHDIHTCVRRVSLKRGLLSRIALRLLKIIEPYLVEQNRMANAQLLGYGSQHLGQNLFFIELKRIDLGSLVTFYNSKYDHTNTIQSAIFEEKRSSNGST